MIPLDTDSQDKLGKFKVGVVLKARLTQPRSQAHNAFFHVFISEVFHQWPERHHFQPSSELELRAWLLCKAGHCEKMVVTISEDERNILVPVIKAFRTFFGTDKDRFTWVGIKGNALVAMRPMSLRYEDVDQHWFQPIAEEVFAIIEAETGFKADEHHKAWQRANSRQPESDARTEAEKPDPKGEGENIL